MLTSPIVVRCSVGPKYVNRAKSSDILEGQECGGAISPLEDNVSKGRGNGREASQTNTLNVIYKK